MNKELWQWVEGQLGELPGRTLPIILTDSNGHVGKLGGTSQTIGEGGREGGGGGREENGASEVEAIGAHGGELENGNGRMMRACMEKHHMCAVNTHWEKASGPTFYGNTGKTTRVDYIIIPIAAMTMVKECKLMNEEHSAVQHNCSVERRDHTPLGIKLMHVKMHFTPPTPPQFDAKELTWAMIHPQGKKATIMITKMDLSEETRKLNSVTGESSKENIVEAYDNFHYKLLEVVKEIFPWKRRKERHPVDVQELYAEKRKRREEGNLRLQEELQTRIHERWENAICEAPGGGGEGVGFKWEFNIRLANNRCTHRNEEGMGKCFQMWKIVHGMLLVHKKLRKNWKETVK
jgi:hypothetical protein